MCVAVAGGHGKFTHLLLRALHKEPFLKQFKVSQQDAHDASNSGSQMCVVLTDFTESTIDQLRAKPKLR